MRTESRRRAPWRRPPASVGCVLTSGYDSGVTRTATGNPGKRLHYLALQGLEEGRAPHAHVHEIATGLRALGWRTTLFAAHRTRGTTVTPARRLWDMAVTSAAAVAALLRDRPDASYIRWHVASLPYAVLCRWLGVPVVQEVNGLASDIFLEWPATRALRWPIVASMRWQLRHATEVIAVTPELARWTEREGRRQRSWVVPNGANTALFRPVEDRPHDGHGRYVVFFGNLAPWQGIETLLTARRHRDWPEDVGLVVVGGGRLEPQVRAAAAEGLVDYRGVVDYETVPTIVAPALAGISVQEDTQGRASMGLSPLKVYETLACGVPVIVADMPPIAEEVRAEDVGLVVTPGDAEALVDAVARLAGAPARQRAMGARARQLAVSRYSWSIRAGETASVLRRACGGDDAERSAG